MIKKAKYFVLILLVILIGIISLFQFLLVPSLAKNFMPKQWKYVQLDMPKNEVLQLLGEPTYINSTDSITWTQRIGKNKMLMEVAFKNNQLTMYKKSYVWDSSIFDWRFIIEYQRIL